jgi:hypothetical protein
MTTEQNNGQLSAAKQAEDFNEIRDVTVIG